MAEVIERVAVLEVRCEDHDRKLIGMAAQLMNLQTMQDEGHGAAREAAKTTGRWFALSGIVLTAANVAVAVVLR